MPIDPINAITASSPDFASTAAGASKQMTTLPSSLVQMRPDRIVQSGQSRDPSAMLRALQQYAQASASNSAGAQQAGSMRGGASNVRDVDAMSLPDRFRATMHAGIASAAADSTSAVGAWIKAHPGQTAAIAATTGAAVAAQAVPVIDVGVDVTLGAVGATMYAAAGPEHQANVSHALGRLQDYVKHVKDAKTLADLQRASADFTDFLKIGGKEAIDAIGVIGGVAAAPSKLFGLAPKIKQIGGLDGVVAAGTKSLTSATYVGQSALKAISRAVDGMAGNLEGAGKWLDSKLVSTLPLQPAMVGGSTNAARALHISEKSDTAYFAKRYTLSGEEGPSALQGHSIKKHVGLSESELRNRFKVDVDLDIASTFRSEGVANRIVGNAIKANDQKIQSWLSDTKNADQLILKVDDGKPIGSVLVRGANAPVETTKATVCLSKSQMSDRGYFVKTAYPSK